MAAGSDKGTKPAAYTHENIWMSDKELFDQCENPQADMIATMSEIIGRRYAGFLAKDVQAKEVENLRANNTQRVHTPTAALHQLCRLVCKMRLSMRGLPCANPGTKLGVIHICQTL